MRNRFKLVASAVVALLAIAVAHAQAPGQEVVVVNQPQKMPDLKAAASERGQTLSDKGISLPKTKDEPFNEKKFHADLKQRMAKIDGMKRLPGSNLMVVEAGGKTLIATDNGRFVIGEFKMVDMWNSKVITRLADLDGVDKVDLRALNANPDDMGALVYGKGEKEVVVFVDPICDECQPFYKQIKALESEYTFKFLMLPAGGGPSNTLAKKLICSTDKRLAGRALVENTPDIVTTSAVKCDSAPLAKAIVIARVIGIDGVPFTISPKQTSIRGTVKDLAGALRNN